VGADWRIDAYRDRNVRAPRHLDFSNNETPIVCFKAEVWGSQPRKRVCEFLLGWATAQRTDPQDPQFRKSPGRFFAQDTWKITRKLTFTYGVRWDRQGAADEIHQRCAVLPTTANPSSATNGATIYEGAAQGDATVVSRLPITKPSPRGLAWLPDYAKTIFRADGPHVRPNGLLLVHQQHLDSRRRAPRYNSISFVARLRHAGRHFAAACLHSGAALSDDLDPRHRALHGTAQLPPIGSIPRRKAPRINQWNIGISARSPGPGSGSGLRRQPRRVAAGHRLEDLNGLTPRAFPVGLSVTNAPIKPAEIDIRFGLPQAAGFALPYAGFPVTSTLAQALRRSAVYQHQGPVGPRGNAGMTPCKPR